MSGTRRRSFTRDAAGRPRSEVPALVKRRVRDAPTEVGRPPSLAICRTFDIAVCQRTACGKRVLSRLGGVAGYDAHLVGRPRDVDELRAVSRGVVEDASQADVLAVDTPFGPGDAPDPRSRRCSRGQRLRPCYLTTGSAGMGGVVGSDFIELRPWPLRPIAPGALVTVSRSWRNRRPVSRPVVRPGGPLMGSGPYRVMHGALAWHFA